MKEYTVNVGGTELTMLLDAEDAKARGAKPVQAPAAPVQPAQDLAEAKSRTVANKARSTPAKGQA